jgi:membrane protein DedA with SNARE-associated domain
VVIGLIALAAAIAGSSVGYAIGRLGGRVLVLRYGRYVLVTSERLDKAERFIDRRGWLVVTAAGFIEGLRQAVGLVAGITGMRWPLFLACNAAGAAAWVAVWASVGDLAGSHITVIYQDATRYSLFALIVLAALAVGLVSRMRCAAAVRATASTPTPVHTTSTPRTRTAPRPTRLAPRPSPVPSTRTPRPSGAPKASPSPSETPTPSATSPTSH